MGLHGSPTGEAEGLCQCHGAPPCDRPPIGSRYANVIRACGSERVHFHQRAAGIFPSMLTVELWLFTVTDPQTGRRRRTTYRLTLEEARERYIDPEPVPWSLERREVNEQARGHGQTLGAPTASHELASHEVADGTPHPRLLSRVRGRFDRPRSKRQSTGRVDSPRLAGSFHEPVTVLTFSHALAGRAHPVSQGRSRPRKDVKVSAGDSSTSTLEHRAPFLFVSWRECERVEVGAN